MPEKKHTGSCIVCGHPSQTVVCMRCFFNYDHRAYKSDDEEEMSFPDSDFRYFTQIEDLSVLDTEFEEIELEDEFEKKHPPKPRFSWFSRFPRFS